MTDYFRPLPLLGNPHVQTVLATLLSESEAGLPSRPRLVPLPDGDHLLIFDSVPPRWKPGAPLVLMVHGLSGCHRSGYLIRLTRLLLPHGYRVVRMNMRGAGGSLRYARRTYNAGCSADVRVVAETLLRDCPSSPLVLVGFSLGGNVVLKLAGEAAKEPLANLSAVAAVSPPVDLAACAELLQKPANRFYDLYFGQSLVRHVQRHRRFFPELPRIRFPEKITLRQFDDLYTAPRGGFADTDDYHARCSAAPLIPFIHKPTLILTARDDPFIAVEPLQDLPAREWLTVRIVDRGGHLGFLGADGRGGVRWAEPRVAEWIRRIVRG